MNSFNHYSLGSVGAWLYADVAGIDQSPDSVGFRDLVIRPRPGGRVTWAAGAYDTPAGRVSTRWELADDVLRLDVVVPPGATATVHVPTTDPDSVRESNCPIAEQDVILLLPPSDNAVVCQLPSGHYAFTARA